MLGLFIVVAVYWCTLRDMSSADCVPVNHSLALHAIHRRWQRMCRGPERYDAMREAHEYNGSQPCRE